MNIVDHIAKLDNKINYTNQEISMEKNNDRKRKLLKDLEVLKLQKEVVIIRKKIKELEMR
jgi:hypothetical protein